VVFHLIRSGEPGVARQAIDFAAARGLGIATPSVIGRLEDQAPGVRQSARAFLVAIGGEEPVPHDAGQVTMGGEGSGRKAVPRRRNFRVGPDAGR
jgi:hypothetical protein